MRVARVLLAFLGILATPALVSAETFTGLVVDPQGLAVVGAVVSVRCGNAAVEGQTDWSGRFDIAYDPSPSRCTFSVSYPGLEPYLISDTRTAPKTIALRLAPVAETVSVEAVRRVRDRSVLTLSAEDLHIVGPDSHALVSLAKLRAGAVGSDDVLSIDGLSATSVPLGTTIRDIAVSDDPFSAEFTEGFQNRIDVVTRSPGRQIRIAAGGTRLGLGGGDVFAPSGRPQERTAVLGASAPVGGLPIVLAGSVTIWQQHRDAALLTTESATVVTSARRARDVFASAYFDRSPRFQWNAAFTSSMVQNRNDGAGGLTLPEAAFSADMRATESRAWFRSTSAPYHYRGGLARSLTTSSVASNSDSLGIFIPDAIVAGGSLVAHRRARTERWTTKHVVEIGVDRLSMVGLSASRQVDTVIERPNVAGTLRFPADTAFRDALDGTARGTWFVDRGVFDRGRVDRQLAVFGQRTFAGGRAFVTRAGIRADYQEGGGVAWSPRLSTVFQHNQLIAGAGAGLFTQAWSNSTLLAATRSDGGAFVRSFVSGVTLDDIGSVAPEVIVSATDPGLTRERDLVVRASVERSLRTIEAGVEYMGIRGDHLLGSRRLPRDSHWADVLESSRAARRHQLQVRLAYTSRRYDVAGHYTWVHARDNGDGAFSFPARSHDLAAEWARTAGLSRHNVGMSARVRLPADIACLVVGRWTNAAPYAVTTGKDVVGNGLFTDRGPLARNSGGGPAFASLDMFIHKRVDLSRIFSRPALHAEVRIQGDNLLGAHNYSVFGSIVGSRLFGRPVGAFPGRSLKISIGFDR